MGYRIIAQQTSEGGTDREVYQVRDSDGVEYCRGSAGQVEATPNFSLAVERYCELTGEDPDMIDSVHEFEIDGVRQSRIDEQD